jgi:hypothetical protein
VPQAGGPSRALPVLNVPRPLRKIRQGNSRRRCGRGTLSKSAGRQGENRQRSEKGVPLQAWPGPLPARSPPGCSHRVQLLGPRPKGRRCQRLRRRRTMPGGTGRQHVASMGTHHAARSFTPYATRVRAPAPAPVLPLLFVSLVAGVRARALGHGKITSSSGTRGLGQAASSRR